MGQVIPMRVARTGVPLPVKPVLPVVAQTIAGEATNPIAREMVRAAMQSWMDGDPLTQREQRIVETVVDTNYFGQLGRLAFGG
jgi:hypothetical protein